jgi:SAM-dependent methyltransferase/uncharacterized protein YbaR (Trm112 family)
MWEFLACPRDKKPLRDDGASLVCEHGHRYPVIEGIPILLVSEAEQTNSEGARTLAVAAAGVAPSLPSIEVGPHEIDPFVRRGIVVSNGNLYRHLAGPRRGYPIPLVKLPAGQYLKEYPIPRLRLPAGQGRSFLELGCNWGRWCIAAARAGYRPVGIDPSFEAVRAANRVAKQLGVAVTYIVADSRYLPFPDGTFDQVFSYNVLQHLSKENVRGTLAEVRRTLKVEGGALVQMANAFGLRCLYHQVRRGFRQGRNYEVRFWRPAELLAAFTIGIGPSKLSVDGYLSLNVQPSDLHLMPARYRALVHTSEWLRQLSAKVPLLAKVADSLYISARRVA